MRLTQTLTFLILFMVFTVLGTLSHEFGHLLVANSLGYETTLHYSSISWTDNAQAQLSEEVLKRDKLLIALGGPIQTILTGITGLLLLLVRRKRIRFLGFQKIDWLAVFLSLFWLRQVFNLMMSITEGTITGVGKYFGGDEARISSMMGWHYGTLSIALGIIGLLISLYVFFKVIPKPSRLPFISGGIPGAALGYGLWMVLVGPLVLP